MKQRVGLSTLLTIWTVVLLIASLIVAGYVLDSAQEAAVNDVVQTTNYLLKAREADSYLVDMETAQRGYLITEDPKFLQPYDTALQELPDIWSELERNVTKIEKSDDPQQLLAGLVTDMRQAADRWQKEAADPQIQMVRNRLKNNAASIIRSKDLFDAFRAAAGKVDEHLNSHIHDYTRNENNITVLRRWLLLGLGILALAGAILATRIAQREHRLQEEARRIAEAERSRLQIIMDNLPVAIRLVSAPEGDVLIQNRAANELLPSDVWNRLKPAERISYFDLRRPDGTPMLFEEVPVIRALREGISLRDQELRMSLPGTSTRILLSSTAPLRDEKGNVIAAVNVLQDVTATKELDQRKDEFIATAAHELRSPLTTISGYSQLLNKLLAGDSTPPKATTYLQAMTTQLARLNSLVEHLLDASRIQLGRLVLDKSRLDLVDVAHLVANGTGTYEDGKHPVKIKAPAGGVMGNWDKTRIEQVLTNLVSNAMRYSPPDTPVEIVIEKKGKSKEALVKVIDQGPGVPPEQRSTLFDRYNQGANTPSPLSANPVIPARKRGALGLGLYLSSEIVKAHGGAIGIEPNPAGGSIFWFTLPIEKERVGVRVHAGVTNDE